MALFEMTDTNLRPVRPITFAEARIGERYQLQAALRDRVDAVAPGVLVLDEEFGDWDESLRRIDLLGLDRDGTLVVIELKVTEDGGHMELQALRYAAMISTMTFDQAVAAHVRYLAKRKRSGDVGTADARTADVRTAEARTAILEFLGWSAPGDGAFGARIRVVLLYRTCDISSASFTGYTKGHPPRSGPVARIADEYEVDCNWLLLGIGGEGPVYVNRTRSAVSLSEDLAQHVAQAVGAAVSQRPPFPDERYSQWRGDGDLIMEVVIDGVIENFEESRRWERAVEELAALRKTARMARTGGEPPPAGRAADGKRGRNGEARPPAVRLSSNTAQVLADAIASLQRAKPLHPLAAPQRIIPVDPTRRERGRSGTTRAPGSRGSRR